LACPARFERATYGLEVLKIYKKQQLKNDLQLRTLGSR